MSTGIPATLADLTVPIDTLKPYGRNPRRGDLAAIKGSLEANGQYRPVVVRAGTGEILAGNHTYRAALELGWTTLAATFVDVDDDQAARIVLVDNRTSDLAGYDDPVLAELLSGLRDLDGSGYGAGDLEALLADLADKAADPNRDTEPGEPPTKPTSKTGDVWELGGHRLACGDSTSPAVVDRLVGDEQLEMVWTDPPYGVDYVGKTAAKLTMQGDTTGALYELVHGALELASGRTRAGGAIYLAHSDVDGGDVFRRALRDGGWQLRQVLIWVKNHFVLSRQDYHWQHEPILYGWKPGAAHRWHGGYSEVTIWDDEALAELGRRELVALVRQLQNERDTTVVREDRAHRADLHPTLKPVPLVARHLANSSRRGEIVYEPFAGSGSTLIAADNLGRRCYAVELDPRYCDVIVDRWQRHTGGKARRRRRAR